MEPKKHDLTYQEGQFLLRYSFVRLAEKMGDDSFTHVQRVTCDDQMVQLRIALRPHCIGLDDDNGVPRFGVAEGWLEDEKEKNRFTIRKEWKRKTIAVDMNRDAQYAALWALYIARHPASSSPSSSLDIEEVVIPLAKKLEAEDKLRKKLKMADPTGDW